MVAFALASAGFGAGLADSCFSGAGLVTPRSPGIARPRKRSGAVGVLHLRVRRFGDHSQGRAMERLRLAADRIREQLGRLTVSQKLVVGSMAVVLLLTLFVVKQYTATPDLVPLLPGASAEDAANVENHLRISNVSYEMQDGQIMVPPGQHRVVLAQLAERGMMPADTRLTFDQLVDKQSWTQTTLQTRQMGTIARQNELALVIAQMTGISRASVIMDVPERRSLGKADRTPTASVTIFGNNINQTSVDAIANLVASSTAGLSLDNVRVIDGTTNRQYRARTDQDFSAANYQELVAKTEHRLRDKLLDMVAYIEGAIVTVHVQADVSRQVRTRDAKLDEDEGSVRLKNQEQSSESRLSNTTDAVSPGVRANLQASADSAGSSGTNSEEETGDTGWTTAVGSEITTIEDPRGHPTKISAVVNIPRPYFERIFLERAGEAEEAPEAPTDQDLEAIRTAETERIAAEVRSLIDMSSKDNGSAGEVHVSMIPVATTLGVGDGDAMQSAGFLGLGANVAAGDLVSTVVLGVLALIALGVVVITTFRANKREPLPSAEEIVGVPPAMEENAAILGEAMEADTALAGLELSEAELGVRQMRDQISQLVQDNPERAASLIGHWIEDND